MFAPRYSLGLRLKLGLELGLGVRLLSCGGGELFMDGVEVGIKEGRGGVLLGSNQQKCI